MADNETSLKREAQEMAEEEAKADHDEVKKQMETFYAARRKLL